MEKDIQIKELQDKINYMENSRSWKITKPLRKLREGKKRMKNKKNKRYTISRRGKIRSWLRTLNRFVHSIFSPKYIKEQIQSIKSWMESNIS